MYIDRSPPQYKKYASGGSTLNKVKQTYRNLKSSSMSLSSSSKSSSTPLLSTNNCLNDSQKYHSHSHSHYYNHNHNHNHNQHQHHHSHSQQGSSNTRMGSISSFGNKRSKRNWGTRERSGMSFLIVIAFFAVFGMIILTEVFMIDERSHSNLMSVRHGGSYVGRYSDSMPDYDNVKDDYDLLDENILSDSKLGFITFRDNKLKIQDADGNDAGHYAGMLLNSGSNGYAGGGGGGLAGGNANIPWGKLLPTKVEETLPHYPIGIEPTDGSWQVVNGTRFKFFVFSAYYDRRDNAKLVRVVGATKTRSPERVWCRFWYMNRNGTESDGHHRLHYTSVTVMARTKIIRENWNLKYSACFVLCPVRTPEVQVPHHVSIVARLRAPPGNILELRNTDWDKDFIAMRKKAKIRSNSTTNAKADIASPGTAASSATATAAEKSIFSDSPWPVSDQIAETMAVCVKPFHFNYDQSIYLMEYLELYAILGVTHFTFYNHTIGPHATCVLKHYMDGDIPMNTSYTNEVESLKMEGILSNEDKSKNTKTNNEKISPSLPTKLESEQKEKSKNSQPKEQKDQLLDVSFVETPKPKETEREEKPSIPRPYIKPTIDILPWNLRMRSQKEIRTEGLFAALNDCLYRNMYRFKYLALVDLDEFIIPRRTDTLNDLITSLNRRFRNPYAGAYSFQNAFFYLQFADDTMATQPLINGGNAKVRAALVTQRKTKRRYKLHPQKQRSKYICRPEHVVEAGNHFVWEFSPGRGSLNVPPQEAILQHYRVCEFGGNDCIKGPSIVDRTAIKYVDRLVQRVEAVYKHLKGKCDLPELPALPLDSKSPPASNSENNDVKTKFFKNDNNEIVDKQTLKATILQKVINTNEISSNNQKSNNYNNERKVVAGNLTPIKANNNNARNVTMKRKRKMIIFENNEFGEPVVKVEYV